MAKKVASFADKVAKDAKKVIATCPQCGAPIQVAQLVVSKKITKTMLVNNLTVLLSIATIRSTRINIKTNRPTTFAELSPTVFISNQLIYAKFY